MYQFDRSSTNDSNDSTTRNVSWASDASGDRKRKRLNSSHTDIYTLPLHDALPILEPPARAADVPVRQVVDERLERLHDAKRQLGLGRVGRSEEKTPELQSHRYLHSSPTRRSSDLRTAGASGGCTSSTGRRRTTRTTPRRETSAGPRTRR